MARIVTVGSIKAFRSLPAAGNCARLSTDERILDDSVVIVSTSNDVFQNLALEDWLYQKVNWKDRPPTLMLWRNTPCVVIGRHQNPWLECRLSAMRGEAFGAGGAAIALARRNSGGGTVFHDMGNLNCTFFTSKAAYDRKANLELICNAIRNCQPGVDVDVHVSPRLDILLDGHYKVSGTASKLGRDVAYHHCTVLVDVDTTVLSGVLRSSDVKGVQSRATASVKSPVRNLDGFTVEDVAQSIATLFTNGRRSHCVPLTVDPTENRFPGITETAAQLRSWDWIFGRCPPFSVERLVRLPRTRNNNDGGSGGDDDDDHHVVFKACFERGIVKSASVEAVPPCDHVSDGLQEAVQQILGCKFRVDDLRNRLDSHFTVSILVNCLSDLI